MSLSNKIHGSGGGAAPLPPPPVHTPKEAPNTLRSKASAKIIDLVSEGEIGGLVDGSKSIFLDGIALQSQGGGFNFQGVTVDERFGLPDQPAINGFSESENEVNVGTEIKKGSPVVVTVVDPDITAIRVKISLPALFEQTSLGDVNGTSVQLEIQVREAGANYTTQLSPTIVGKTMGPYEQQHRVELVGTAPFDIRVVRTTADSTESSLNNKTFFGSFTEVIDADLMFANSAVIALKVDSQLFGGRVPKRSYELNGLKINIPSNYDPVTRIYTGIWDGTFKVDFSNNPAWVFYDVLVNKRYGLGDFIEPDAIDKWTLFTIGQYCDIFIDDGFGGTEPRFTINTVINTRVEAYTLINTLASVFRGLPFWSSGAVTATQDSPADSTRLVTAANVIDGLFSYEGSGLNSRHTAVLVTWNDPTDEYKPAVEVVENHPLVFKLGWKPLDVGAFGVTSRGQAHRVGLWILDSEENETEIVGYSAALDHADVKPGDIISITDPSRAGVRLGGRILSFSGASSGFSSGFSTGFPTIALPTFTDVVLDQDYTVVSGDKFLMILDDGTIEEVTIDSNVTPNTLRMTGPFSSPPVGNAVFIIQPLLVAPTEWRVVSVVETDDHVFKVSALRHDKTKYDRIEAGVNIEQLPTSLFPKGPLVAPTNLTVVENLYKSNNSVKTRMNISFTPAFDPRVVLYRVEVRPPLGNWEIIQLSTATVAEVPDVQNGLWDIAVTALSSGGSDNDDSSRVELLGFEVFGKTLPPADVQNLQADRRADGVFLTWDEVPDLDLVGYDIRQGPDFGLGQVIVDLFVGTSIFVPLNTKGPITFLIRARDELGIPSDNVTAVVTQLVAPPPVEGFQAFPQGASIHFNWEPTDEDASGNPLLVSYEIRAGLTWESGQTVIQTGATSKTILFPTKLEEQITFHIKSISQAGIFSDAAAFYIVGQAPELNRNEILSLDVHGAGWLGIKNNMEVVSTNLLLDEVSPGVAALYGEYSELIDLGLIWRARNWLETRMILFQDDALIWSDANFAWEDPQAETPWLPTADTDNATLIAWLAEENNGVEPPELNEGWSLDSTLLSFLTSTAPVELNDIAYVDARYHKGLKIDSFTRAAWDHTFPSVFTYAFTLEYDVVPTTDVVYARLETAGVEFLEIGFEANTGLTYCRDHLGNKLTIDTRITLHNFAIIAVSQNSSTRALYVYETETDVVVSDTDALVPVGSLDHFELHVV